MKKIVGFKITLRPKEIQRRAKKAKVPLEELGISETELEALVLRAAKDLKPAVLFDTFSQTDPDQGCLSCMPGLAYSLILATVGEGFSRLREESPALLALWGCLAETALDEAVAFAARLLEADAEKEACELSPLSALSDAAALETLVKKLDGPKIGVRLADGRLAPEASRAVSLSWLSKSKARGKSK